MSWVDDLLVPDMWWVRVNGESYLFAQLPAQGGKGGLARLNASTRCRPHIDRSGWLRNDEPTQQDAIVLVENDRTDRATQIDLHRGHPHMLSTRDLNDPLESII